MSPDLARLFSFRSPLLYVGTVLLLGLGLSAYGWYDHLTSTGETVAGNVTFAGEQMEGMTRQQVREIVVDRAVAVIGSPVLIDTPQGSIEVQASELGYSYDIDAMVDRVFQARHRGGILAQFVTWVTSLTEPITVPDETEYDSSKAHATLAVIADLRYTSPVEPGVEVDLEGVLQVQPGVEGSSADIDDLVERLGRLDPAGSGIVLEPVTVATNPQVDDAVAQALADNLNDLTRGGIALTIGGVTRQLTPRALRQNLSASTVESQLQTNLNLPGLQTEIEALFPEPVGERVIPTFEVSGESVTVASAGKPAEICCTPDTAEIIGTAVLNGASGPLVVKSRPADDPVLIEWFEGSLIVERVSSFTTPHSCCENRVTNIQRMADLVRGYYLLPGEVLSLNDYIGPRTAEKGFVPAGAIRGGHLTPEIGGGVSQFATTIFNAAYFAGLDFLQYQAHSLYFTRYPYGREATISNPAPDLVFQNTTEFPVLIWTSYTGTSITVSMYSTKNVEAEQVATRSSKRNQCTYVETDRLRTYDDGRTVTDTFFALYRPADGIDCNGNRIPEEL